MNEETSSEVKAISSGEEGKEQNRVLAFVNNRRKCECIFRVAYIDVRGSGRLCKKLVIVAGSRWWQLGS